MMDPSSDSDSTRLATGLCPCLAFGFSGWGLDGTHADADLLRMHRPLNGGGHVGAPHRIRRLGGGTGVTKEAVGFTRDGEHPFPRQQMGASTFCSRQPPPQMSESRLCRTGILLDPPGLKLDGEPCSLCPRPIPERLIVVEHGT